MFKCQISGKFSKPREKSHKITVETRDKIYFENKLDKDDINTQVMFKGIEIVKEFTVCEEIYLQMKRTLNE